MKHEGLLDGALVGETLSEIIDIFEFVGYYAVVECAKDCNVPGFKDLDPREERYGFSKLLLKAHMVGKAMDLRRSVVAAAGEKIGREVKRLG